MVRYIICVTKAKFIWIALLLTTELCLAQQNLEQSYSSAAQKKDYKNAMGYALQLGDKSLSENNYDKAFIWYSAADRIAAQLKNSSGLYQSNIGLGNVYLYKKNYTKATDAFENCIVAAQADKSKSDEATGLYQLAQAEEMAGHYKKTISPLEKALALAVELKNENLQMDCYRNLASNLKKIGDAKEALRYSNLYQQMENNRKNIANKNQKLSQLNKQVIETETSLHQHQEKLKYTEDSLRQIEAINSERQLQIDLLQKDKELSNLKIKEQNAELENDRLWRNSLIIGLTLLAALAIVIILNYQSRLRAKEQIHKQNENIKSSITYAKRIQDAMLPSSQTLAEVLPDSFVLFKPRDTVSGDFYWFAEIPNEDSSKDLAFAAVDCTGHGVPGAFMSMIGMNSLNGIINRGIIKTDEILSALHKEIRSSLRQPETGNNDGMDIALCIYKKDKKVLEFSCAKNPVVYIQNSQINQVKGDIHPMGGSKSKAEIIYKRHEITIDQPTMIYLFSDGYRDQFGGKDNSKFMSKKFNQLLLEIHQLPMHVQKEQLEKIIEEWRGERPQTDDILVMGIKLS